MCYLFFIPRKHNIRRPSKCSGDKLHKKHLKLYKRDALASFEDNDKWQRVVSHMEPRNKVMVVVVFGNGFTVKKTTIYFIYDEPIGEQTKHSPKQKKHDVVPGEDEKVSIIGQNVVNKLCIVLFWFYSLFDFRFLLIFNNYENCIYPIL